MQRWVRFYNKFSSYDPHETNHGGKSAYTIFHWSLKTNFFIVMEIGTLHSQISVGKDGSLLIAEANLVKIMRQCHLLFSVFYSWAVSQIGVKSTEFMGCLLCPRRGLRGGLWRSSLRHCPFGTKTAEESKGVLKTGDSHTGHPVLRRPGEGSS